MALDVGILDSKEFSKLAKHWGDKQAKELIQKTPAELKELLASKQVDKRNVIDELNANEKYQAYKAAMKDFNAGKRESLAPIEAAINVIALVLTSQQ